MKKNISRIAVLILAAILFAFSAVNAVFAASTGDAVEQIDTTKNCSLKLTYQVDSNKIEGLEIEVYQVATVTADLIYSMTGDFSDYSIEINHIKSQSEWNDVKDTVSAYIAADKLEPTSSGITDADGVVLFEELPVGIYYVNWTGNENVDQVTGFASFLIAVPGLDDEGKWIYDVDARPKPGMLPPSDTEELTVVKLWRDDPQTKRPDSIEIEIFRNGDHYVSTELTADGNWTYTWAPEGLYAWTAVERNVPDGYAVSISSKGGNTIQITNTYTNPPSPPPPPQTGDSSNLYLWIILMAVSGIVLIVFGRRTKKQYDE